MADVYKVTYYIGSGIDEGKAWTSIMMAVNEGDSPQEKARKHHAAKMSSWFVMDKLDATAYPTAVKNAP